MRGLESWICGAGDMTDKDNFPRITMEDDTPLVTFDDVMGWIFNFLAAVGAMAFAAGIGLYFGGFFHWLLDQWGRV